MSKHEIVCLIGVMMMSEVYIPSCLRPIDNNGLKQLAESGKADPNAIKTLKCKTVLEGQFKNLNYIRSLPPVVEIGRASCRERVYI